MNRVIFYLKTKPEVTAALSTHMATPSDWVLQTSNTYTIDTVAHTLTLDGGPGAGNASGTILLHDGSTIVFTDIDQIEWA